MKRVVTLLLAAGLFMGAVAPKAEAAEVKFSGHYEAVGRYFDNMFFLQDMTVNSTPIKVDQRFRVNMNFVASESLSAYIRLQTTNTWGNSLGAFSVSQAYMTWLIPNTDIKVRMGYVADEIDSFTMPTSLSGDGSAGVRVTAPINDNFSLIAGWHRPIFKSATTTEHASTLDVFTLQAPVKFNAFSFTPSLRFAMLGENIGFGSLTNSNAGISSDTTTVGGSLFPIRMTVPGSTSTRPGRNNNSTIWWAGLTSQYTGFAPFNIAFDFHYGAQNSKQAGVAFGDSILDRKGWLTALKLDYAFDFGKLSFLGWYSTGDNSNPLDGSERMPSLGAGFNVAGRVAGGQDLVFAGTNTIGTAANAYGIASGTWGLALGMSGISFFEGLTHGIWVEYAAGSNNSKIITKYAANLNAGGIVDVAPYRYLTNKDSIVQFGLINTYNIYKELQLRVQLAYAIENFSKKTWIDSGALPAATKWGNIFETEIKLTYTF